MQFGNAIDRVTPDDGEIGHADHRFVSLLDQRHATNPVGIARPSPADLGDKMRVDLVDDVEQPRQQATEHRYRPHLERFGQQRVVGVGHRVARDVPGLAPVEVVLVDEQAHQLGDRHRRVRVIELEAILFRKRGEVVAVSIPPVAQGVLQGRRGQEVLLSQTQFLAVLGCRVRVQHHRDVLGRVFRGNRIRVATRVELLEVEFVARRRGPQTQRVDDVVLETGYGDVVRDCQDVVSVDPNVTRLAAGVDLHIAAAAELDRLRIFDALDFPRKALAQPGVGLLDLVAVVDALVEHAVAVTNAVADDRQRKRRAAVEEAGCQATEAAVAEPGVALALANVFQVEADALEGIPGFTFDAEVE